MTEIRNLLQAGRHDEAARCLREICDGPAANAESWFLLGALSGIRGQAAAAEDCFRKALRLNPGMLQARFNLGIALRDQGRFDDARAELEAVAAARPDHAEACNALGYVYVRLARQDDAERCFRLALTANPSFPEALANLGNVLSSRCRWDEAVQLYRRALQVSPGHADAALNLGSALMAQGHAQEAITFFQQAVAANPASAEAHVQLGIALKKLGKPDQAGGAFREALKIQPDHAEARYFLAMLGETAVPPAAPTEYVVQLFDQYAEVFDSELVGKLHYRSPEALRDAVASVLGGRHDLDVLDIGCGTGLCGPLFKPLARTLTGVDLSSNMIAKARARKVYDDLELGDLVPALHRRANALDLVIAADVFVYIGELVAVFSAVRRALRPGGLLAFTAETAGADARKDYVLRSSGRYAHAAAYLHRLALQSGLEPVLVEEHCLRLDNNQPIPGMLFIAVCK